LFRDHNSPDDEILSDDGKVDLAKGNVFYSRRCAEKGGRGECEAPAKLAYSIDDRFEIGVPELSVAELLDIFSIPKTTRLFRDYESPNDKVLVLGDSIKFDDGPVFYTESGICGSEPIIAKVNRTEIEFSRHDVSGLQIKEEAIKKIPSIKIDFPLFKNEANGKKVPISDEQIVHLERDPVSCFTCVAPDDNS
jgi:hypothetical protein